KPSGVRADRFANTELEWLQRHGLLEERRSSERQRSMQVRSLDDGVAVADQLNVHPCVLRNRHQLAGWGETTHERHIEPNRVPWGIAQHLGQQPRIPDRIAGG